MLLCNEVINISYANAASSNRSDIKRCWFAGAGPRVNPWCPLFPTQFAEKVGTKEFNLMGRWAGALID
jgi:hypothetical protein